MNDRRPLFSIVMPAYGVERYIADSIACVQAQTIDDWELIVVDDASPDRSAEIAEDYARGDERIRVVYHEANKGASEARNTGIDAALGLYLWMPDPDDRYDPRLLEMCARALAENPASVTVFGVKELQVDAEGSVERENEVVPDALICATAAELRPHLFSLERATLLGYSANKVYDLDFLRGAGVRWESAPLIEDFFFNIRVFEQATSLNVVAAAPYTYLRRPAGSLTHAFVADYYPLHRRRIAEMRDALASWGLLDEQVKSQLGALYARYILSAVERTFDARSGMNENDRALWMRSVFVDELFCELVLKAQADTALLKACLVPLKARNVEVVLALGRAIHLVRGRSDKFYGLAKQGAKR